MTTLAKQTTILPEANEVQSNGEDEAFLDTEAAGANPEMFTCSSQNEFMSEVIEEGKA